MPVARAVYSTVAAWGVRASRPRLRARSPHSPSEDTALGENAIALHPTPAVGRFWGRSVR